MNKYIIPTLLILLLISCGKSTKDDGRVNIIFWHSFVPSTFPALEELIAGFEKENPAIKITAQYVPTGDALIQKLITSIQSKTAPDISWVHADFIDKLVQADAIYSMQHFITGKNGLSKEDINDIFPPLLDAAKWNNTLYALPMEGTVLALLYNKSAFRNSGLNPEHPPKDWNELFSFSEKLTIDKNNDGKTDQYGFYIPVFPASGQLSIWMVLQWVPFLWQAGGNEINDDQTKVLFNSNAGEAALELWKRLYIKQGLKSYSLSHDLGFVSQTITMVLDGPWNLPLYRKIKDFEWGVASLPAGPDGRATYFAGEHLTVFKQSKNPDAAWRFLKYIIRPDVQARFSINSGYLPVRKSTLTLKEYRDYLEKDLHLKSFVDQIEIGRARSKINYYRVEINQTIAGAVEKVLIGNSDAKAALDEAANLSNRFLAKVKRK